MILALTSIFSSVTPVFAKTDKEILFRDIPWGTSFSDTKDLFPDQCLYGIQLDGINAMSTKEILTGTSDDSNVYDGKICLYAQPLDIADVDVAGYSTPYLNFFIENELPYITKYNSTNQVRNEICCTIEVTTFYF